MKNQIKKTIEIARALKPLKQCFREWHCAVIFDGNIIKSIGYNTSKTHPRSRDFGYPYPEKCLHAETMAVIRGKLEDYRGHDLIVIRVDNNGKLNNSKPCKYCEFLLRRLNFNSIIFSDSKGNFEELT